jgi:hypothetical protein
MYYLISILLILEGVIIGIVLNASNELMNGLNSFFAMTGSLATTGAAIFAYNALSSWREVKLDTLIDELRDQFNELIIATNSYAHSKLLKLGKSTPSIEDKVSQDRKSYLRSINNYQLAFSKLHRNHKFDNNLEVEPHALANKMKEIIDLKGIRNKIKSVEDVKEIKEMTDFRYKECQKELDKLVALSHIQFASIEKSIK